MTNELAHHAHLVESRASWVILKITRPSFFDESFLRIFLGALF